MKRRRKMMNKHKVKKRKRAQRMKAKARRLIVVDSGPAPSPFFSNCADPRVTYVHVRGAANDLTIGEKRNRALAELATSPVVANFDDDDLFAYDAETRVAGAFDAADPPAAVPASLVETERKSRGFGFVYARSGVYRAVFYPRGHAPRPQRRLHALHGVRRRGVPAAEPRRPAPAPPAAAGAAPFGPMRGVFVFDDAAAAEADVGAWRRRVRDYDANRDRVTAVGAWRGDQRAAAGSGRADRAWRHAVAALQP
ncbi:hypothetical protein JL720_8675 [Aureococcus anophagefferens]|nr:hypothetical protein JL720_8675 [Aureococcus anophagefferens]